MTLLLDPIISDPYSLNALVQDAEDPRWFDGSLNGLLEQRLASEHGRFLRIVQRMDKEFRELKKLLGIKDGNVRIQQDSQRPSDYLVLTMLHFQGALGSTGTAAIMGMVHEAFADQF